MTQDVFARAAAAMFSEHIEYSTFTSAEIDPDLLAIRWGLSGQAVMVVRLDENFRPLIYGDCLPSLRCKSPRSAGWTFQAERRAEDADKSPWAVLDDISNVLWQIFEVYADARGLESDNSVLAKVKQRIRDIWRDARLIEQCHGRTVRTEQGGSSR